MNPPTDRSAAGPRTLTRQIGLGSAVSLNMLDMIGVGPFITLPLVVAAMGGPQAMLGWILGALIALCDGLVWAELGAAMPEAGGSYAFLREIYGARRFGRLASFLYVWQLSFTAPLSIASGCIGLAQYASYMWPGLRHSVLLPHLGAFHPALRETSLVAAGSCVLVIVLLYRNVRTISRMAWVLWGGVLVTMGAVILAGFTHFHTSLAFHLPAGSLHPGPGFFAGLGTATLIATYDYWGYYNICFLGGEVRNPGRNIPRAILISIVLVAALYLLMNVSVLGVIPARELAAHTGSDTSYAVVAVLLERTFGPTAARVVAALVIWSAFASVFSLLLGYSRVPFAAARDGNYFRSFGELHPRHGFPHRSLLLLGLLACVFCFFNLEEVIAALVAIRIVLQFLMQQVGVILLRRTQPARPRPFRIWLYPLPPLLALAGFLFILVSRREAGRELLFALVLAVSGTAIYLYRARRERQWPFARG